MVVEPSIVEEPKEDTWERPGRDEEEIAGAA
jgi:hypothetical protein